MKNIIKKIDTRRIRITMIKAAITLCSVCVAISSTAMIAFADSENNTPSSISKTSTMNTLVSVVFWIIRIIILIAGGGPALIKIVQGQADENPRDRNSGIIAAVVTGACFAASFVMEGLIKP